MMDQAKPMNVLFVMADQHQAKCTGYEGHSQAITPNMDRLAKSGMRFRHCYTANPICTPTRVSILSGQYCHNHGYYGLGGPTPHQLPSFLQHFKENHYQTAAIGKLHLPIEPHEWAREHCHRFMDIMEQTSDGKVYQQYLEENGFKGEFDASWLSDQPGTGNNPRDARPSKLPFRLSVEGYVNTHAMHFMDDAIEANKPFCMEVSYHRPHQVYTPDQKFWDMYPDDIKLPPGALEDLNEDRAPHFLKGADWSRRMEGNYEPSDPVSRMKRVWKGYLACITHCDHALGELLDYLDHRGIADNTIVIYTSDHGAYSGTFGINEKAPGICSEQVCRIPMVWRVPGATETDRSCEQLAHIVDVAPTIASLCGLPEMDWVDGENLTDLLRGGNEPVRNVAVTEHPWSKSVRWKSWRLVHYQREMFDGKDFAELYDITNDPLETTNLADCPEHAAVLNEGRRLLLDWLIQTTRCNTYLIPKSLLNDAGGYPIGGDGKLARQSGPAATVERNFLNYL